MALRILCCQHRSLLQECTKIAFGSRSRNNLRFVNDSRSTKIYKHEEARKIRFFMVTKYLDYMKNYEQVLMHRFPKVMTVYRTFMDGVKNFIRDSKEFLKVVRIVNSPGNSIKSLTRRELELYHKMPADMKKVAPILVISILPFVCYVLFPVIYMFPKQLLTSHFWTKEQNVLFCKEILKARLSHTGRVNAYLVAGTNKHLPNEEHARWSALQTMMRGGKVPAGTDVVACKDLFAGPPFRLEQLQHYHVWFLLKVHGLHTGWFRVARLGDRAVILKAMDNAIVMEGGVHNLTKDALNNACYIRGLNPDDATDEEKIAWLQQWMVISKATDKSSLSLLLHAPIFLGLHHPANKYKSCTNDGKARLMPGR